MTDVAEAVQGTGAEIKDGSQRRERRRKGVTEEDMGLKLPIPREVQNRFPRKNFVLRWFRNEDARIKIMHGQDWDPVEGVEPIPGATDRHGNPCDHILMVKHRDWYEQDRAHKEARRKEEERRVEAGEVVGKDGGESLSENIRYTGNNQLS